mmetsp:Transcript_2165/g.3522  ORF Transcript_2165/g.3522 Transcript_2165/m.3522 type:complete len:288 (+) Transcript_2165:87-950(+)|eukprot:CAMPEP_0119102284 /NCGR_PEP_ID=MMETSP1180-20130426/1077_1 /TAXON_ID=3052 ORGANISM="Chlamydomonas cf sp, Strain CCMP681" /NCGR_SAMPLE_ID=MMETSP1180 /ASSEMBLY_ACC=CAM_ASM_000741 /LENGTH=287 /DNA_ID=CAMNT_0007086539 /DNA_START=87 /DNA_END=950 /DNA_ORIENTATION=+
MRHAWTGLASLLVLMGVASINRVGASPQRRRLHRDLVPARSKTCMNTMQGLLYLTDDLGFMCSRQEMDYSTGCCKAGTQYSCTGCSASDKCCSEYESCVSCCLAPQHNADKLHRGVPRAPKYLDAGAWQSAWEYCKGICRTHGRSTVHENAYISTRHHCYSASKVPMVADPLPSGALAGVKVALANPNETCETACKRVGKTCSPSHFPLINSCDKLREHVACEAGCEPGRLSGGSAPAYIQTTAPKPQRPAMCFTFESAKPAAPGSSTSGMSCTGSDANAQRLCPCA